VRRPKHELPGVQHERLLNGGLDQVHETRLLAGRIDVGVPRVAEHLEAIPEMQVYA